MIIHWPGRVAKSNWDLSPRHLFRFFVPYELISNILTELSWCVRANSGVLTVVELEFFGWTKVVQININKFMDTNFYSDTCD